MATVCECSKLRAGVLENFSFFYLKKSGFCIIFLEILKRFISSFLGERWRFSELKSLTLACGLLWVDFLKIPSRLKVPCFIMHVYLYILTKIQFSCLLFKKSAPNKSLSILFLSVMFKREKKIT